MLHLFQMCFAKTPVKLRRDTNAMPNYFGKMMTSTKRKAKNVFFSRRLQNICIDKNGRDDGWITVKSKKMKVKDKRTMSHAGKNESILYTNRKRVNRQRNNKQVSFAADSW